MDLKIFINLIAVSCLTQNYFSTSVFKARPGFEPAISVLRGRANTDFAL